MIENNNEVEIWKPLTDFDEYLVSDKGSIISLKSNKIKNIKVTIDYKGYARFSVCYNSTHKTKRVHREVAKTFLPNQDNLPEVNHKNGIKTDNRVENLEWISHDGNIKHAVDNNLMKFGSNSHCSKLTEFDIPVIKKRHLEDKISQRKIAKEYGVSYPTINAIISGRKWLRA